MKKVLITAAITTFGRPELLRRAIHSVLNQNFRDFELLIIDDAGQPCVDKLVDSFSDPRIKYYRHKKNMGLASARNTALHNARGKYIAYLDADDEWFPEKLKHQYHLAEYLNKKKIGGFDPVFRSQIDHDIWMNMAMNGWLAEFVDKPLVRSREHFNPRITSDYSTRLETINRYFEKWQPLLVKLQTPPGAAKYKIDYTNYVIGWLAREQFKQGKYVLGLCCLKLLKVHNLSSLFIYMDTLSKCGLYILLRWFYITLPIPNMFRLFPI